MPPVDSSPGHLRWPGTTCSQGWCAEPWLREVVGRFANCLAEKAGELELWFRTWWMWLHCYIFNHLLHFGSLTWLVPQRRNSCYKINKTTLNSPKIMLKSSKNNQHHRDLWVHQSVSISLSHPISTSLLQICVQHLAPSKTDSPASTQRP